MPLKKGQTLTNNDRNGNHRPPKDSGDQAVVLTLRKRYSAGRRGGRRQQSQDSRRDVGSTSTGVIRVEGPDSSNVDAPVINNPWEDARPRARQSQHDGPPLAHRLSYDHASGVIMLPDDGEWLDDDDDDDSDEQNYGTVNGHENESILNEDSTPSSPTQQLRPSRYGTYFHHPERAAARRRQSIPGAFPPS